MNRADDVRLINKLAAIYMKNIVPKILFIVTLFSCHADLMSQNSLNSMDSKIIIGEWISTKRDIPYKAILKINSDSYFNYEFGECGTHGISNGKWFIKNNYIVLNNNNPDSTLYIVPYMRIKPGIYLLNVQSKDNSITKKVFIV